MNINLPNDQIIIKFDVPDSKYIWNIKDFMICNRFLTYRELNVKYRGLFPKLTSNIIQNRLYKR